MSGRPVEEVKIWGVQDRRASNRFARPWIVRWKVNNKTFQRHHRTRSEADHYRSLLLVAQRSGERFDPSSGEPTSWSESDADCPMHEWARRWLAEQWSEWQPRTRTSAVEALSRFVPLVLRGDAPAPDNDLRPYLVKALRPDCDELDPVQENWLTKWSVPLSVLDRPTLAEAERVLGLRIDGEPLAANTATRFRSVSRACVRRAVDLEIIASDPWPPRSSGSRNRKAARKTRAVDVRSLPDPATMQKALAAIESHQPASRMYQLMTSVVYYGGLRPSEVIMLRPRAIDLPSSVWGEIYVAEADISFDEPGEPKTGRRRVPIPPVLVELITDWIDAEAIESDGLLFRTRTDQRPSTSNWRRSWNRAMKAIGEDPIRIYDCRHAAATTWLSAGVPLGEVARRLGHSVDVLVSTYVGALSGDETAANGLIESVLTP